MLRRLQIALVVLLLLGAAGYVAAAHLSGGALPTFGLPLGGERGHLRRVALAFLEDLQFRDFAKAASYHSPEDQDFVDIPYLIQKLFAVKPEALDIMDYEIVLADIDSSGERARVKSRVKAKFLVDGSIRDSELMLYFFRDGPTAPWFMKFDDSIRQRPEDKKKKGHQKKN